VARIVVGVDGSSSSEEALVWAADEAKLRNASLHIVHSWVLPPMPSSIEMLEQLKGHEISEMSQQLLDDAAASVADRGIEITTELSNDSPAEGLIRAAQDADLLVVGSRGRGGFKGLLLGSVSQHCAHYAPCPLVIVRRPSKAD